MIEKHLYKRTITKNGKQLVAWYFWFWKDGKQVRRSCGKKGTPCLTKKEAQIYLASLTDEDLIPTVKITLGEACEGVYDTDSEYSRRMSVKGKFLSPTTRVQKKINLNKLLRKFGDVPVDNLRPADYDRWLISLDVSNSTRNNIVTVIREIYQDLYYRGIVQNIPIIESYSTHDVKEKGIFTMHEIQRLFPRDIRLLVDIWTLPNGYRNDYDTIQFATMILMLFTTGMRSGEIRALKYHQRIKRNVLLLNAMINDAGERVDYLKKGSSKDKKWRLAIMPERTVEMLDYLESFPERTLKQTDYIFERVGNAVTTFYLLNRFRKTMLKNGIDVKARNISIHSTRFTYNSIMRREISDSDLRLMLGHATQAMTDYYDKSTVIDKLPSLLGNQHTIDSVWEL